MEKSMKRYMPIFVFPTFFAFILGFIIPFILGVGLSFQTFVLVYDSVCGHIINCDQYSCFCSCDGIDTKTSGNQYFPYYIFSSESNRRNCAWIHMAADF